MGMMGLTFRPGNGVPGVSPGLWRYDTWREDLSDEEKASLILVSVFALEVGISKHI
jgi:hypothetical protein